VGTSLATRANRALPGRASAGQAVPGWVRRAWDRPARGKRPSVRDLAIAAISTVIAVFGAYGEAHPTNPGNYFTGTHRLPNTPNSAFLLVVLAGAALAWRNTHPRLAVCVSTAATVAFTVPGYENGVMLLLPAFALFSLTAQVPVMRSVAWVLCVTAILMVATAWRNPLGTFGGAFTLVPANTAVAFCAGIAVASRRAYTDSVRVQSATRAAQEAQRRVDEERLRIARELHDVVAHTMATITVQAAAATTLLHDRPEEAAQSLRAIRAASKDGLRELHAILNVLRNAGDGEPADPTQPTPGLARLDALTAGVRAAGLPVTVRVTGQPRPLPAVTDLSAYRIIQEALTNTLRHAGPATAEVTVDYDPYVLSIEVTDTGRGLTDSAAEAAYAAFAVSSGIPLRAPVAVAMDRDDQPAGVASGHGLRGMRERAAAAGGTVDIGPLEDEGFRVAARLPLAAALDLTAPAPTAGNPTAKAPR
jgi:signal transduction histidine kinase